MQKTNYVLFFTLKIAQKKLLCIYNALCLSQLETYELYQNHKLKQTGRKDQKTSKKSRLGTLAWVQTMTHNHCRLKKASANQQLTECRLETTDPKTLITDLD